MKPDRSKLLAEAKLLAGRVQGVVLALRAPGGAELDDEARKELLTRAVARQEVRLELDIEAYEQETGKRNRNNVRWRDGSMMGMGATGKGTPFLRDHRQYDVTARGGTVLASKTTKLADGHYKIHQTVELTEPSAVERALRGLMSSVSVGIYPSGDPQCTACKREVFGRGGCYHWPGDTLKAGDAEFTVEWEFPGGELVETSEVSVPAVPSAGITGIRAALAALPGGLELLTTGDEESQETDRTMKLTLLAALAAIPSLGLAATASEDDALAAVTAAVGDRDRYKAELGVAEGERVRLAAEVATFKASERKHGEDTFIRESLADGRIGPADEPAWRVLYGVDAKRAAELMAQRAPGQSTPAGEPRQSDAPEPDVKTMPLSARQKAFIEQMGMTEDQYRAGLQPQKGA